MPLCAAKRFIAPARISKQLRQYASLQNAVNIQAVVYSYVDDLRYLAVACFLCAPIVFFVRRVKARKGAAAAAH